MKLYLIRHGKTYCNEKRLYCGKSDVPLSENGIKEIKEKVKLGIYPKCNLNFTSGFKRANETFEYIYPNKKYEVFKGLSEYDFGDFELKSYEMLKENKDYLSWILDKSKKVTCLNGESRELFEKRIKEEFLKLIELIEKSHEEEALIVSHGGTIATILEMFEEERKDFYTYQPKCASGYKLDVVKEDKNIKLRIIERF